jgi:hypothetical protein
MTASSTITSGSAFLTFVLFLTMDSAVMKNVQISLTSLAFYETEPDLALICV